MSNNPDAFSSIFSSLEFANDEFKGPRNVRVGRIDKIQEVALVPKVAVKCNDAEAVVILDGIGAIVSASLGCGGSVDPAFMLPEAGNMVIIPTLLLTEWARKTVRGINGFWVGVMVTESGKQGTSDVVLEQVVESQLGVLGVRTAELIGRIVRNQVT